MDGRDDRRATEGVADQQPYRPPLLLHEPNCQRGVVVVPMQRPA